MSNAISRAKTKAIAGVMSASQHKLETLVSLFATAIWALLAAPTFAFADASVSESTSANNILSNIGGICIAAVALGFIIVLTIKIFKKVKGEVSTGEVLKTAGLFILILALMYLAMNAATLSGTFGQVAEQGAQQASNIANDAIK